ncbi:hypothetical protein KY325_04200 [Candidatus Woesearchaeota archaeon]|nr:hypothetical protein [Candidatus Woesearchaeota archaeon]MBW3018337.1 hypothetical protein [Candidatus Woesearchaeota archaeon]
MPKKDRHRASTRAKDREIEAEKIGPEHGHLFPVVASIPALTEKLRTVTRKTG